MVPGIFVCGIDVRSRTGLCVVIVEGNLIANKGEQQYYDYSIAVSTTLLLALTHVPNLVAAPVWFVRRMYGESYSNINSYKAIIFIAQ